MGSTISSLRASAEAKTLGESPIPSDDDDDEDIRPAKRRRPNSFHNAYGASSHKEESPRRKPFGHVTNESKRAGSRLPGIQAVRPSDFYGRCPPTATEDRASSAPEKRDTRSKSSSRTTIQDILPKTPIDFKRALRIEILGIKYKPASLAESLEFARGRSRPMDTKCRCSVALFSAKNDDDPTGPIWQQDYSEVYRKSKICTLRTTFDHREDISRELLLEPFILSADEFYVNRRRTNSLGDYQYDFDFSDKYYIQVTLEPVGLQKCWPPFDITTSARSAAVDGGSLDSSSLMELLHLGKVTRNDLCLGCSMPGLLDPDRQVRSVDLKLSYGSVKQKVAYGLQIQLQWSLPSQHCNAATKAPIIESPQPVKSAAIPSEAPPSPSTRKQQASVPPSPADRSSRRRSKVPTYNLRALSAQAQGKSPRARKSFRRGSFQEHTEGPEDVTVTYSFGRADATELGAKQKTSIPGFICPFCSRNLKCLDDLRLHFHTNHSGFKLSLRRSNPSRVGFFIELARKGHHSSRAGQIKTFQLGKPVSLFDLENFLTGDQYWLKGREHNGDQIHESSSSPSPHESIVSSPNTSNDTDEAPELEKPPKIPSRTRKIFYVPKTSRPLYDALTKRVLQPGEEVPDSDDEKDESWLHQKHRDVILDFTDVMEEEKDFITKWNPFIVDKHLTSEKHLGPACLQFAKLHASWFARRKTRKIEFGKLMETFIMRGIVEQACLDSCADFLRAAESKNKEANQGDVKMSGTEKRPVSPSRLRGLLDCVCGEHTQPPDRIICRGRECKGRFFHRSCALESGRPITGAWFCDYCFSP